MLQYWTCHAINHRQLTKLTLCITLNFGVVMYAKATVSETITSVVVANVDPHCHWNARSVSANGDVTQY